MLDQKKLYAGVNTCIVSLMQAPLCPAFQFAMIAVMCVQSSANVMTRTATQV